MGLRNRNREEGKALSTGTARAARLGDNRMEVANDRHGAIAVFTSWVLLNVDHIGDGLNPLTLSIREFGTPKGFKRGDTEPLAVCRAYPATGIYEAKIDRAGELTASDWVDIISETADETGYNLEISWQSSFEVNIDLVF